MSLTLCLLTTAYAHAQTLPKESGLRPALLTESALPPATPASASIQPASAPDPALPAEPQPQGQAAAALQGRPDPQSNASIFGTVLDIREGLVPNVQVALETPAGVVLQTETSDSSGLFDFKNVPAGNYKVRISAPGLETFLSYQIALRPGEHHMLPHIALPIASSTSDVTVTATQEQIASEQIHAQIQQRALGVFPNFYTSYLWSPAPLKAKNKFYLAFRSTVDPVNFITTGVVASVEQWRGTHPGYGSGAPGFARRYGADYGNIVIGRFIAGAILPSLFRQDPRYFYQGTGSNTSRALHAISNPIITRGDNGRNQPNYSYLLGITAAAGITNLYYPDNDRTAATIGQNILIRIASQSVSSLFREFISRRITTKVPDYATGKPETPAKATSTPQP